MPPVVPLIDFAGEINGAQVQVQPVLPALSLGAPRCRPATRQGSCSRRRCCAGAARYITGAADLAANGGKLPEGIPEMARSQLAATLRRDADGLIAIAMTATD
jgi:hypothetical protein